MPTTAKKLIEHFGLKVLNPKEANTDREIRSATINRAGLQLGGLEVNDYYRSTLVAWGTKEFMFFNQQNFDDLPAIMSRALSERIPIILLSNKYEGKLRDIIVKVASKFKIPALQVPLRIADISVPISSWIAEFNDKPMLIHGSLVVINGVGVMITGPAGIGKSESVLELIHNQHIFVSDDSILLSKIGQNLTGRSPSITQDLLEARGIGLINVAQIYGRQSMQSRARIELEIELMPEKDMNKVDRLGDKILTKNYMGSEINLIQIPTGTGRSLAVLIEAATNVYLTRKNGINPTDLINERLRKESKID